MCARSAADTPLLLDCAGTTGDMLYLEALGQPILILGNLERTEDLLEKRATSYSDRPVLPALQLYVLLLLRLLSTFLRAGSYYQQDGGLRVGYELDELWIRVASPPKEVPPGHQYHRRHRLPAHLRRRDRHIPQKAT